MRKAKSKLRRATVFADAWSAVFEESTSMVRSRLPRQSAAAVVAALLLSHVAPSAEAATFNPFAAPGRTRLESTWLGRISRRDFRPSDRFGRPGRAATPAAPGVVSNDAPAETVATFESKAVSTMQTQAVLLEPAEAFSPVNSQGIPLRVRNPYTPTRRAAWR
jgi:hypothetical protein